MVVHSVATKWRSPISVRRLWTVIVCNGYYTGWTWTTGHGSFPAIFGLVDNSHCAANLLPSLHHQAVPSRRLVGCACLGMCFNMLSVFDEC